jgi:hypothetical protein
MVSPPDILVFLREKRTAHCPEMLDLFVYALFAAAKIRGETGFAQHFVVGRSPVDKAFVYCGLVAGQRPAAFDAFGHCAILR